MEKYILCKIEGEVEKDVEFASGVSQNIDPFDFERVKAYDTLLEAEIALKKASKNDFFQKSGLRFFINEHFILTEDEAGNMLDFYYGEEFDNFIKNKILELLEDAKEADDDLGDNARIVKDFINGNFLGFRLKEEFKDFILKILKEIQY